MTMTLQRCERNNNNNYGLDCQETHVFTISLFKKLLFVYPPHW